MKDRSDNRVDAMSRWAIRPGFRCGRRRRRRIARGVRSHGIDRSHRATKKHFAIVAAKGGMTAVSKTNFAYTIRPATANERLRARILAPDLEPDR